MIERTADRLRITAPMIMANACGLLEAGRSAFQGKREIIDLSAVHEADSSALAVLLAWLREAQATQRELVFTGLPAGLTSLADLYGIAELLPRA